MNQVNVLWDLNHIQNFTCSVASVSNSGTAVATGDDQGTVTLYPYPPKGKGIKVF